MRSARSASTSKAMCPGPTGADRRPRQEEPRVAAGLGLLGVHEEDSGETTRSQHAEGMIVSHVEGPTGAVPGDPGNQSVAELIKQVSEEPSRLLRSELRLAQAEMTQKAKTAGVGIGAFGAAAVLGWFALGCLLATAILALALVLPAWLAA
jgi:hypothetical protein